MKRKNSSFIWIMFLTFSLPAQPNATLPALKSWQTERIAPGLEWKWTTSENLFGSRQNFNVLIIDLSKRSAAIVHEEKELKLTSAFARERRALAAVNAGFFDMQQGGSMTYLMIDGKAINQNRQRYIERKSPALKGVFLIEKGGDIRIESTEDDAFHKDQNISAALVTGPILIKDGRAVQLSDRPFTQNRHPRTCACITQKGRLLLLTADGRNEKAQGLSLPELTRVLQRLDCQDAINFDGGGSTTMYIKGKAPNGIVNRPSDNRKFDAYGERRVANALLVF